MHNSVSVLKRVTVRHNAARNPSMSLGSMDEIKWYSSIVSSVRLLTRLEHWCFIVCIECVCCCWVFCDVTRSTSVERK